MSQLMELMMTVKTSNRKSTPAPANVETVMTQEPLIGPLKSFGEDMFDAIREVCRKHQITSIGINYKWVSQGRTTDTRAEYGFKYAEPETAKPTKSKPRALAADEILAKGATCEAKVDGVWYESIVMKAPKKATGTYSVECIGYEDEGEYEVTAKELRVRA